MFCVVARHLGNLGILKGVKPDAEDMLRRLVETNDAKLREVTAEAMAYLQFLRRFAGRKAPR